MRKLIIGLASAAALAVTALPAAAQHHHHFFGRGFGFGGVPWWLYATPLLAAPYGFGGGYGAYGAAPCGAGYGAAPFVQPPCAGVVPGYAYPYGFVGPRRIHPHVNTK